MLLELFLLSPCWAALFFVTPRLLLVERRFLDGNFCECKVVQRAELCTGVLSSTNVLVNGAAYI